MIKVKDFVKIDLDKDELMTCCGSITWVSEMVKNGPYKSKNELLKTAEEIWYSLDEKDWKEAFSHHPKIGDKKSLKKKSTTRNFTEVEQAGIKSAKDDTLTELDKFNSEYENKFGYIFIVCATGKTAGEMLSIIKERIKNKPEDEIKVAMGEHSKITKLRIEKLI